MSAFLQDLPHSFQSLGKTPGFTTAAVAVSGVHANLFVNGARQPCLIVHDLKLGKTRGKIALWIGQDTDGYFSNLTVR